MAFPLRVIAGPGLVARSDNFVAVSPGPVSSLAPFGLDRLFGSYEPGDVGWAALVRQLATAIIEAGFLDHPPIAACELHDTWLRVFIFGDIQLELQMQNGERVLLDGGSTSTWIDRKIDAQITSVSVGADPGDLLGSLQAGVVPGAGFVATVDASILPPPLTVPDPLPVAPLPAAVRQSSPEPKSPAAPSAPQSQSQQPSPFVDSEMTIEPSPSYNPKPKLDTSFPRASSHLSEPAGDRSSESFERLDTDFEPDSTATIGTNELAEIRAAVAASAMAATAASTGTAAGAPEPPSPKSLADVPPPAEPKATLLPPPPPPPTPEPAPPQQPTLLAPPPKSLADLPPPPANYQAPLPPPPPLPDATPALPDPTPVRSAFGDSPPPPPSRPALSHRRSDDVDLREGGDNPERSPYAPPENDLPPPPIDDDESTIGGSPLRRRGIFAAVPSGGEAPVDFSPIAVTGVRCPQGHLNRMQTPVCAVCDTAIDAGAPIEQGNRPSLGQLQFDDGTTYPLDRPYVIGRRPESSAPGVGTIFLDDERHMVSKRHAEIRITGWDVKIVDLDSSNGTKVFPAGGSNQQALRLRPNDEVLLTRGSHVQIGDRTFQFVK